MSNLYEIIETAEGEIVLRRAGEDENSSPLVSISFSEEALYFLHKNKLSVAKAMIEAGLEAAGDDESDEAEAESSEDFASDLDPKIIH